MKLKPQVGKTYQVPFPFHLVDQWAGYNEPPSEGWKPGAWLEEGDADAGISRGWRFDDWGWMLVEVIEKHKISGFLERCFFVVTWISPEGTRMGKRSLQCRPTGTVTRMLGGHWRVPTPENLTTEILNTATIKGGQS